MAGRLAPYTMKTLTRAPRTLYAKFTAIAKASTEQTLTNTNPFNDGIVNIATTANTGEYKISLGASATSRDTYAYLAGMTVVSDETDDCLDYVSNLECNHATDPNVSFYTSDSDATAGWIANDAVVTVILEFLDSKD